MSQPGERHADISLQVLLALHSFATRHQLGKVRNDVGFLLRANPDRVVAPDVGFIASGRLPGGRDIDKHFPVAPSLAVEVVSPNDDAHAVADKVAEYLDAGSARVWVINPAMRTVDVHRPGAAPVTRGQESVLASEDAGFEAGGFELAVGWLFAAQA